MQQTSQTMERISLKLIYQLVITGQVHPCHDLVWNRLMCCSKDWSATVFWVVLLFMKLKSTAVTQKAFCLFTGDTSNLPDLATSWRGTSLKCNKGAKGQLIILQFQLSEGMTASWADKTEIIAAKRNLQAQRKPANVLLLPSAYLMHNGSHAYLMT